MVSASELARKWATPLFVHEETSQNVQCSLKIQLQNGICDIQRFINLFKWDITAFMENIIDNANII